MTVVLYRVDERLIHGQVVIGWGYQLRPERYVVVDDVLARSDWEQDLYRLGAGDADVVFTTVEDARGSIARWRDESERSIVLTRDIGTMLALARGGTLSGENVNLGGLHHEPGRTEVLTYLHLSPDERGELEALVGEGVNVYARDLPDAHKVPVETLLS